MGKNIYNECIKLSTDNIKCECKRWVKVAYDLSDKLGVAISSRALFDLEHENQIFENNGIEAYTR